MGIPITTIARFSFVEALRNRLLWLIGLFLLAGFLLVEFIGEVAITETVQFQSGFLGALLRISAVLIMSLFVISSMVREFNDKGMELVLSLPMTRATYLAGKLLGYALLALLTALLFSLILLIYAPADQVAVWGVSLGFELLIVTAFSVLCLLSFTHVTPALSAVMAFYFLSRVITGLQLMSYGTFMETETFSQQVVQWLVAGLAFVLPDLNRFTQSDWLVYHTAEWTSLLPLAGQSFVYLTLLMAAALFDLYRKNF
jgi:ABC-type transport system involved in multi-copper enzyme maturation permease subunit